MLTRRSYGTGFPILSALVAMQIGSVAQAAGDYPKSILKYSCANEVRAASNVGSIDLETAFRFNTLLEKAAEVAERETDALLNKPSRYSANEAQEIDRQTVAEFRFMKDEVKKHTAKLDDVHRLFDTVKHWKIGHCQVYRNEYDEASGKLLLEIKNLDENSYPADRATIVLKERTFNSRTMTVVDFYPAGQRKPPGLDLVAKGQMYGEIDKKEFDSSSPYNGAYLHVTVDKNLEITGLAVAKGDCSEDLKPQWNNSKTWGLCKFYSKGFDCFNTEKIDGKNEALHDYMRSAVMTD